MSARELLVIIAITDTIAFLFGFVAAIVATRPVRETYDDNALGVGAPQQAEVPFKFRREVQ